jgi:hypothetical protein
MKTIKHIILVALAAVIVSYGQAPCGCGETPRADAPRITIAGSNSIRIGQEPARTRYE